MNKAIVIGYHNMGCAGLEALLRNGFEVQAVFTHPDDPNEGQWFDSLAELAARHSIPTYAPEDINHPLWVARIRQLAPDFLFSFYYRNLVKPPILAIPGRGCLNLHGSLLPRYRGRAPLNWVLVNGESETGVTLHYMTPRADDGDIVCQTRVPIATEDTALSLGAKLVSAAAEMLDEYLGRILDGSAPRQSQDHAEATYVTRRRPADALIDWRLPARDVANLVRAVTRPYPGAFTTHSQRKLLIWDATVVRQHGDPAAPGTVLRVEPFVVGCGEDALQINFGQTEGGVFSSGAQICSELNLREGTRLGREHERRDRETRKTRVLILGINGFIGNALTEKLLASGKYEVHGMDQNSSAIGRFLDKPDFYFHEGDIGIHREWIEYQVKKCDVVLPLVAIRPTWMRHNNAYSVTSCPSKRAVRGIKIKHHSCLSGVAAKRQNAVH